MTAAINVVPQRIRGTSASPDQHLLPQGGLQRLVEELLTGPGQYPTHGVGPSASLSFESETQKKY